MPLSNTRVLTTFSLSGGQGKTLVSFMLGIKAAKLGIPTLLIDCDPQATLSDICAIDTTDLPTLYEVFDRERRFNVEDAVYPVPDRDNLFIIPADNKLGDRDNELKNSPNCSIQLKQRLAPIVDDFSLIIIDTGPSRNLLAMTAVGASTHIIVPIEATGKGIQALPRTWSLLEECIDSEAFRGELVGLIPFRAKMTGRNLCHEARDAIDAMTQFLELQSTPPTTDLILPMILESDLYKKVYSQSKSPSEVNSDAIALETVFDVLLQKLNLAREVAAV